MNKKTIGIIGIIVLVIVLIVGATIKPKEKDNPTTSGTDILTNAQIESQNVKEDEQKEFSNINVSDYMNMYNGEEKTLVLVARPTCGYCQIAEPILHNIAYKYDININYLNTDDFSEEDSSIFVNSNEKLKGFGTPMLLVVNNGNINDMVDGLTDTTHYIEFLKKNEIIK